MPRRGGKDSVRPNDPKMRAVAADNRIREVLAPLLAPMIIAEVRARIPGSALLCNCGVPWMECTRCSKPVRR